MQKSNPEDKKLALVAAKRAGRAEIHFMLSVNRQLTDCQDRLLNTLATVEAAQSAGHELGLSFRPRQLKLAANAVAAFEMATTAMLEVRKKDPRWLATKAIFFERLAASASPATVESVAWAVAVEASKDVYLTLSAPAGMPGAESDPRAVQREIAAMLLAAAQNRSDEDGQAPISDEEVASTVDAQAAWNAELIQALAAACNAALECVRFYAPMVAPGDEADVRAAEFLWALLDRIEEPFEVILAVLQGRPPVTLPGVAGPVGEVCYQAEAAIGLLLDLAEGSMEARTLAFYGSYVLCSLLKMSELAHGDECLEAFQSLCADDTEFAHALGIKPLSA